MGVSEFDLQGDAVPSEVLVHGPLAFPISTTKDRQAFLAGAYYGLGRVIVVTHESFLSNEVKSDSVNGLITHIVKAEHMRVCSCSLCSIYYFISWMSFM